MRDRRRSRYIMAVEGALSSPFPISTYMAFSILGLYASKVDERSRRADVIQAA